MTGERAYCAYCGRRIRGGWITCPGHADLRQLDPNPPPPRRSVAAAAAPPTPARQVRVEA